MAFLTWFDVTATAPPAGVLTPWPALTPVASGDFVSVSQFDGISDTLNFILVCTTAGTTGAAEPDWIAGVPGPISDGSAAWTRVPAWAPATTYSIGDYVVPTDNVQPAWIGLLQATVTDGTSAVSGDNEPPFGSGTGDNWDDFEGDGSLIPPDAGDNDTGTGTDPVFVDSTCIFEVWEDPAVWVDGSGNKVESGTGNPGRDEPPIGVLTYAYDRMFRPVRNNCGEGFFEINANDEQAAWLRRGRIIVVYRESTDTAPVFAWSLETFTRTIISEDEEGGEVIQWRGRGVLALLSRAILFNESYLPNGSDLGAFPTAANRNWHWTDRPPGAILVRCLEEARQRGTEFYGGIEDSPMPSVYWTFHRHVDSNGDPWDDSAGALFQLPVLDNLFYDVLPKLMNVGLLIKATPVINGDGHLRVRLDSWANDPGAHTGITFEKGVNLVATGEQELLPVEGGSVVLVQGDASDGQLKYRRRDDDALRIDFGTIEMGHAFHATRTTALLNKVGDRDLARSRQKFAGPGLLQVLERTDEIAMVDYTEWDYVLLTAAPAWDGYEDNLTAITFREIGNGTGEFEIGPEFGDDDPVGVIGMIDPCGCPSEGDPPA